MHYFRIAKRLNNAKRPYLLVNPDQAKHCPVAPHRALGMMRQLSEKVGKRFPDTKLVIGFAETATAIGLTVAEELTDCKYYQTTREVLPDGSEHIDFSEEHSHAVNQRLYISGMAEAIRATPTVVFVDDEISTGKTAINMLRQLESAFPVLKRKKKVLASVINRATEDDLAQLRSAGFFCVELERVRNEDYSDAVQSLVTEAPLPVPDRPGRTVGVRTLPYFGGSDPRSGVLAHDYFGACAEMADLFLREERDLGDRILVLGTEECMLPAILLGERLESAYPDKTVMTYATTRSPISVAGSEGYPIRNGYRIRSFYDTERVNYIYNLDAYDSVIVVTDAIKRNGEAEKDVLDLLSFFGCGDFYFVGRRSV